MIPRSLRDVHLIAQSHLPILWSLMFDEVES